ncbi:MAG TPA: ABC transporter permease [Bacteroidota bacterium]|nr:ABC transporter permease [Bacteroidota bacterium]
MHNFLSIISEFTADLKAQKLRVFLTTFGIVWGTVALIVLVAFGMGFKKQMSANMHGIGESISIMFPGRTSKAYAGFGTGRGISFTEEDVAYLANRLPADIQSISPEYMNGGDLPVRVGENILTPTVTGIIPIYGQMRNIIPEAGGRFLNDNDLQSRRRVVVIGNRVKDFLFGQTDPIGRTILVGSTPFTVIGVMMKKTQPSSYHQRDQDRIFIPASTFAALFGATHLSNIIFKPYDLMRSEEVGTLVREALAAKYKYDPTDKDAVFIWDTAEFDKFQATFFFALNLFLGIIGGFTLGVGGIGVANIMFVVVQERIKEIGIKRAVGAKRANIIVQFFTETFFIMAIGSSIGFVIAFGIIQVLQMIPIKEYVGTPEFSLQVALIAMGVLSSIGLAAGLLPARRAANLDVIECLRT